MFSLVPPITEEAMGYLIERIMKISSTQLRDLSPFDDLHDVDEVDGGLIELGGVTDSTLSNGHTPRIEPVKAKSDCCF